MFRLMVARSNDGLKFERDNRVVTDQGAVPDLAVDSAGVLYLYYTAWTVERQINKTVVAISRDSGATWTFKKLDLERREGATHLVDPDVLILPDGTFRLYVTMEADKALTPALTTWKAGTELTSSGAASRSIRGARRWTRLRYESAAPIISLPAAPANQRGCYARQGKNFYHS